MHAEMRLAPVFRQTTLWLQRETAHARNYIRPAHLSNAPLTTRTHRSGAAIQEFPLENSLAACSYFAQPDSSLHEVLCIIELRHGHQYSKCLSTTQAAMDSNGDDPCTAARLRNSGRQNQVSLRAAD